MKKRKLFIYSGIGSFTFFLLFFIISPCSFMWYYNESFQLCNDELGFIIAGRILILLICIYAGIFLPKYRYAFFGALVLACLIILAYYLGGAFLYKIFAYYSIETKTWPEHDVFSGLGSDLFPAYIDAILFSLVISLIQCFGILCRHIVEKVQ